MAATDEPVTVDSHLRRAKGVVFGLTLGVVVFVADALLFFLSLGVCRKENQAHYPSACPPVDDNPGLLFAGVVGLALLLPLVGWLAGAKRGLVMGVSAILVGCWIAYVVAVLAT